jgi:hypothetical protein
MQGHDKFNDFVEVRSGKFPRYTEFQQSSSGFSVSFNCLGGMVDRDNY